MVEREQKAKPLISSNFYVKKERTMEAKLKHLEFIQNVITRMNSNSFLIKGWTVTLVAALFALAAKDTNQGYISIVYFIVFLFWGLDGFFLSQERQYRGLYGEVAKKDVNDIDFSMDARKFKVWRNSWFASFFSKTLIPFYGVILAVVVSIMFVIR